eukprot:TRINITY_DN4152_c0_g1_i1.p1 TRINITY_DN4152_c0_g1~~TRINITY_DN4152_c0_g1_i1.p1  ORF type:complete len:153 (+),score=16.63 TRINITY_DN4152_c0_g1_i1:29-460(+)
MAEPGPERGRRNSDRHILRQYAASRFTPGNFLFRDRLVLDPMFVNFCKNRWFGSDEQRIAYSRVSSVQVERGLLFSKVILESDGGSELVTVNGFWNGAAQRAKAEILARVNHTHGMKSARLEELMMERNRLLGEMVDEAKKTH